MSDVRDRSASAGNNVADRLITETASQQHGLIGRHQALDAGISEDTIDFRLLSGRWQRLDASVYAIAGSAPSWHRDLMAAVLSVDGALVSGRAAAALHQFRGFGRGRPEITIAPRRNERSRLALVHRSAFVSPVIVDGIPCSDAAHTVFDVARRLGAARLGRLIDDLLVARAVSIDELLDVFVPFAAGRRPGTRMIRGVLAARAEDAYVPPESELEQPLFEVIDHPDLPVFRRQIELPWWPAGAGRVDAYAASCTLIVEVDGRRWHTREQDFIKDRQRDNLATAHGHAVLRFTHRDLTATPTNVVALIHQTANTRGWSHPIHSSSRA